MFSRTNESLDTETQRANSGPNRHNPYHCEITLELDNNSAFTKVNNIVLFTRNDTQKQDTQYSRRGLKVVPVDAKIWRMETIEAPQNSFGMSCESTCCSKSDRSIP